MSTATVTRPTVTRPTVAGRALPGVRPPEHGVGTAEVPRTSTARPWDRLRFAGPAPEPAAPDADAAPAGAAGAAGAPSTVTAEEPLPDPGRWAGALARSCVEVLLGVRPAAQLGRWLTADLYEALARRAGLAVRVLGRPVRTRPAIVRRVRVCEVAPGAVEAAVVLHDGERVRGAAVRLEVHRGRWRATALEIG
ncbi:Rv3235 family protein [Georgenia sp. TF02-10]|uniref:Rv3235 family protein n=1 Tax=Georgenia sp. TF02-10 TaxID=2917725 RepID=UPI001FA7E8B0|nr:Rv3235 family protein [Georgenia sp. TF02-10]UNX55828.1 Rv3235 family protein [Georgenia sp. TF02-10]